MKYRYSHIGLFIITIVLYHPIDGISQTKSWLESLQDFVKPILINVDKTDEIEIDIASKTPNSVKVNLNISNHFKVVRKLRTEGMTDLEIAKYFDNQINSSGNGSITGIVYDGDSLTVVRGYLSLWSFNEYGHYTGYDGIFSGDSGVFIITGLSSDNYYLRIESFGRYRDVYYDDVTDWRDATLIEVIDGQETDSIDFILGHNTGAVSGQVTSVEGIPLSNCYVTAYDQFGEWINWGFTDSSGSYIIVGLPSGDVRLSAEYSGMGNYSIEWYQNTVSIDSADIVRVTEPDTVDSIDFVLDHGGAIVGEVLDPDGTPVGPGETDITVYDSTENVIDWIRTDENGSFIVKGLRSGDYKLQVYYSGTENYVEGNYYLEHWYNGSQDFQSATPVPVSAPDTTLNVDIRLHEAGVVSGQVLDPIGQPVGPSEVNVIAYDLLQRQVYRSHTGADGIYDITKLPSGYYKIFADYLYSAPSNPTSEWYDGVKTFEEAQIIRVRQPDTTRGIDFTLESGGYIMGRVESPEGGLLSYAGYVYAYDNKGNRVRRGSIVNDGIYFIDGLPTGDYRLWMRYSGEENYMNEWYSGKQSFWKADSVNVIAPNWTNNINFSLEYSGQLRGFITDVEGNRLTEENHFIDLFMYDALEGEYIDFENNSFVGGYQFETLQGDYKLGAISFDASWLREHDSLAVTYFEAGTSIMDTNTQIIKVQEDSTIILNNLIMEKVGGGISGTIFDAETEEPVNDIYVIFAFDEEGYLVKVSSNVEFGMPASGEYYISGLRPGNLYLLVFKVDEIFSSLLHGQWYSGIDVEINPILFAPRMNLPVEASPILIEDDLVSGIDFHIEPIVSITEESVDTKPMSFDLSYNFPNPFNPTTTIEYTLPQSGDVSLIVFNLLGQEVTRLVSQNQEVGNHKVTWNASNFASGIYFYRLQAGDFVKTRKMVLLK